MYKYFFVFSFLIANNSSYAQYISSVFLPDTSVSIYQNESDPAVRYANKIKASALRKHLEYIASDDLQGRETGHPGIELAAEYITQHLKEYGVKSFAGHSDYRQPVAFTFSKWLETEIYIGDERFRHFWDYLAFPGRNINMPLISGEEVIFLGFGIDDKKYSDYKGKNLNGKIIMINRGEPLKKDSTSVISGNKTPSEWSNDDMEKKLKTAREKGVKLVLIIENDIKKMLEQNRRKLLGAGLELGELNDSTIPFANHCYISSTIAKKIIGQKDQDIIKARKKLEKGKATMVKIPSNIKVKMHKEVDILKGNNLIGYIEGTTKKDEYVIVSAHYDHIGMRGDDIYNGADDNGSGTVTLLELAKAMKQAESEGIGPLRNVIFMWFTGEEKGLLGSEYYSKNPIVPLSQTVVNVNVDMVGRTDEKYEDNPNPNYIYVIGSDRLSSDLHEISESVNQKYAQLILDYTYNDADDPNMYYFRSDHYNFAKNGVPAIFYFSGVHPDYHRPTDTVDKINFEKMEKVGRLIYHTTWALANRTDRIVVDGEVK